MMGLTSKVASSSLSLSLSLNAVAAPPLLLCAILGKDDFGTKNNDKSRF